MPSTSWITSSQPNQINRRKKSDPYKPAGCKSHTNHSYKQMSVAPCYFYCYDFIDQELSTQQKLQFLTNLFYSYFQNSLLAVIYIELALIVDLQSSVRTRCGLRDKSGAIRNSQRDYKSKKAQRQKNRQIYSFPYVNSFCSYLKPLPIC